MKMEVIHCDLKPENILFTDHTRKQVKIIDFGSACTNYKHGFTYVQSRFYRSPEIVLGLPYDQAVDMWSFACIMVELVTGVPLFPAIDENELMEFFKIRIGIPTESMVNRCTKRNQFFDFQMNMKRSPRSRIPVGSQERCDTVRNVLQSLNDNNFIDLIEKCLVIDPRNRMTAEQALQHDWITQY